MSDHKPHSDKRTDHPTARDSERPRPAPATDDSRHGVSRRDFLKTGAAAGAAGALAGTGLSASVEALARDRKGHGGRPPKLPRGYPILLKGGVVLSMDPAVGDFEKADVLIEGSKIAAVGPDLNASDLVIDCSGMIIMPGFIDTHHHQYETIQRSILTDGILFGTWPERSYFSVVQDIWTTGRVEGVFDLGRSPYDPEDCYISELVASVSQIKNGVTTGVDTSESIHTPEHTDALIAGLMDSGRRSLYVYTSGGEVRSESPGFEYPGAIGDETQGLGRLRKEFFSSEDQLVTLGFSGGTELFELARSFGAVIVNHATGSDDLVANPDPYGPDVELIHATRWTDEAWQIAADKGIHVSIATLVEMSMRHGMPAIQQALDHGILPCLSCDVETNMTADLFSVIRGTFTLQRALLNERHIAGETNLPPLVTPQQVLQMATIAGARAAHVDHKVGSLTPGKEADIIVLDASALNCVPMNNASGTVVTMMDTSNVKHVFIAGELKKWDGSLVGVNEDKLRREIERSRERVLGRIQSAFPEYSPNLLGACCPLPTGPYEATGA